MLSANCGQNVLARFWNFNPRRVQQLVCCLSSSWSGDDTGYSGFGQPKFYRAIEQYPAVRCVLEKHTEIGHAGTQWRRRCENTDIEMARASLQDQGAPVSKSK